MTHPSSAPSSPSPIKQVVVIGAPTDAVQVLQQVLSLAPEAQGDSPSVQVVVADRLADVVEQYPDSQVVHLFAAAEVVLADLSVTGDPEAAYRNYAEAVLKLAATLPPAQWVACSVEGLLREPHSELQRIYADLGLGWHARSSQAWIEGIERAGATRTNVEFPPPPDPRSELALAVEKLAALAPEVESSLLPQTAPGALSARDDRLGALLRSLNSSLLITTYQTNRVVSLHPTQGGLGLHLRAFDRPMGIALTPNGFSLATRGEIIDFRNLPEAAAKVEPAGTYDACLLPRNSHVTGDIAAHDLGLGSEGLWVVATQFSCLATLDEDHSFVPQWRPPFISELAPQDRCHLNGMALVDGRPRFVTALGVSDEPGGWRPNKVNGGVVMAVPSGEIVADGLSMPHSPRWHEGDLYLLDSGRGRLVRCNPATGELSTVAQVPGFARGLSLHGDLAFVGTSQVRETATFGGLPIATQGPLQCGVWAVNIRTGELVASVVFEDRIQELFDVAFLPGVQRPEIAEPGTELALNSWEVPSPR